MRSFHSLHPFLLAVVLTAAQAACNCGGTPPNPGQDAGGGGGGGDGGGQGGGGGGGGGGGSIDGGFDGGVCTLLPNGASCASDAECCSGACDPTSKLCVSGAGACVVIGGECQSNVECCGGRTCAADGTGVKRCIDQSFCGGPGETCSAANQCCSMSCNGTCQTSGTLCAPEGESCSADTDCCSNACNGTTCESVGAGCATLGERCTQEGYDPNCCSQYCVNFGGDGGADLRCAASSTCRARGEICSAASDCCSGVCTDAGICPTQAQLGQKRFVGEPCAADADCASYACASTFPGGPKVCQFLGGCRPAEEICTEDWQCCGHLELSASRDQCQTAQPTPGVCAPVAGVPGLKRCTLQPTDKEVGEICQSGGNPVHNCCGGADACRPTITGVSRCFYGGGFTADGGCTANGEPCSIADQCCSKICAPAALSDGGVELQCSGCIANGGACTTHNDCCGKSCVGGVCEAPAGADGGADAGGPSCMPLGGACGSDSECCSQLCSVNDGGAGTCQSAIN